MPGLSQLKQFNSDILSLGSEPELRAKRGEKPVTFPLPKGIKDIDDSNDFVMGMPEPVNNAPVKAKKEEPEDFSDIMGTASPKASASESAPQATGSDGITLPDLSIINTSIPAGEGEDSGPDLSMFMDEEPEEEVVEEKPVERQIDEFSLDELLGGAGFDGSEGFDQDSYSEENEENQDSEPEISDAEEVTSDESVLNGRESSVSPLSGGDDFSMPDASFGSAGGDLSAAELEGETGSASSASGTKAFDDGLPASLEGLDFGNGNNEAGPDAGDSFGSDDLNSLLNGTDSASAGGLDSLDASTGASGEAGISGSDFGLDIGESADDSGFNGAESAETSFPDASGSDLSSDLKGALDSSFDINDDELLSKAVSSSSVSSDGIEELDAMDFAPGDSFSADDLKELEESLPEDNLLNSLSDKENFNSDDTFGKMDAGLEAGDFSPENLSSDFSADGLGSASEDFSADDLASSFNETDGGSPAADSSSAADSLSFDLPEGDFADLPSDFSDISSDKSDDSQASLDGTSSDGTSFDSPSLDGAASDGASSDGAASDSASSDGAAPDFSMDDLTAGLPSDFSTSGDASDLTAGQDFELSEGLEKSGPEEDLSSPFGSDFGLDSPDFMDQASEGDSSLSKEALEKEAEENEPFVTSDFGSGEGNSELFNADTLDSPDFSAAGDFSAGDDVSAGDGFNSSDFSADDNSTDSISSMDSIDMSFPEEELSTSEKTSENGASASDSSDDNFPTDFNFDMDDLPVDGEAPAFQESAVPETFDISQMEGMEFPDTDAQLSGSNGDFEFNAPDSMSLDNGDFEIPGYTGDNILDEKQQEKLRQKKEEPAAASEDELPPNTLSDKQYKTFLANLSTYPLNVRIAVEDLIVKNEFTDDAEFEIVSKVLKKVPARNLASELEKMLDTPISVPRDYEKRTASEYEAYKASFEYQLRNKIIPFSILGIIGILVCIGLFLSVRNFIYRPAMASSLYRQGYAYLEAQDYPQSEIKFNQATKFKVKKPWFYKYARGYREHKQYNRAEWMYNLILSRFKHEKEAGLEYARMELDDLANYESAETILLRDVLDFHINDPDGLLLLGDTYLEWATEKDPSKFEDARIRYAELLQLYGAKSLNLANTYKGRLMRYFVRTDNLLEVLQLKDSFMPKKNSLDSEGWTELSGFLLDKLYGPLPPKEEYLRTKIEDVKEMLMRAVNADEKNPVALYNLGKYYVNMNDGDHARSAFNRTINAFEAAEKIKRRDMYKYIDAFRLYGEQYMDIHETLKAREQYTKGISLYQKQRDANGFEGNQKIGKLYQDMGDIDYFISGDMDAALVSYENSINTYNDLPEIRYKVGYIKYNSGDYSKALTSFMKAMEEYPDDVNLLLSMGNTLSLKGDDLLSHGYYDHLRSELELLIDQKKIVYPQAKAEYAEIIDNYMKVNNNLGVTFYRLAKRTGSSLYNAKAMVCFQESIKAWDSLTRNLNTMNRLGGSNLAEQNLRYTSQPRPEYEPQIYTKISKTIYGEDVPN